MGARFAEGMEKVHGGDGQKPHRIVRDGGHAGRVEKLRDPGGSGYLKNHPGYRFEGHGNRTKLHKTARSPEQAKPRPYNTRRLQKKTFRSDALD